VFGGEKGEKGDFIFGEMVNQVEKTLKFPNDLTCQTLQSAQTLLKTAESEATSNECA